MLVDARGPVFVEPGRHRIRARLRGTSVRSRPISLAVEDGPRPETALRQLRDPDTLAWLLLEGGDHLDRAGDALMDVAREASLPALLAQANLVRARARLRPFAPPESPLRRPARPRQAEACFDEAARAARQDGLGDFVAQTRRALLGR